MKTERAARPPAVVVGAGLNGLGIVRSLGQVSVPCHLVESNAADPSVYTRFATVHQVPSIADGTLTDSLLQLGEELGANPILFLTQESGVSIVSANRERLAQRFHFNIPNQEIVHQLTTKSGFQDSASRLGAPIPRTKVLLEKEDLSSIEGFDFPVVFKPNTHSSAYSANFRKAYRLNSIGEVKELYEKVYPVERSIVIQEWVDGLDSDIYFCLQYRKTGDEALMSFCGRKLKSHPPMTGGTASCTIAPQDMWHDLVELTNTYFKAAGVTGMCSMEFKKDPKTNRLVMIEPTIARSDYQEEVATWHGYNIPAVAYAHLAKQAAFDAKPNNRTYVWKDAAALRHYSKSSLELVSQGSLGALFSWRDPAPWLYSAKSQVLRKIRGLAG